MILSLVRHSEVVVNSNENPAAWRLSERGLAKAKELARQPRWKTLTRLISSAEQKAVSTGECLAENTGVALEISPDINEVERPSFREDYEDRATRFFDRRNDSDDGWETAAHALGRVQGLIDSLGRDPAGGHVALVGHGMLWALARAWLGGKTHVDPGEWKAISMPDVGTWSITPAGVVLISDFSGINEIGNEETIWKVFKG